MTESYNAFLYLNLIKFSFKVNATEIKSDMDFFRKKESRMELREEFTQSVRSIFLKYLLLVDKEAIATLFSETEKNKIRKGFVPANWSVHHQKPLSWGGRSFNQDMLLEIERTPLTKKQEKECQNNFYTPFLKRCYQMDNFLQKAYQRGTLKETFTKLFFHYLILLPHHIHQELEDNYLMPQVKNISSLREKPENNGKKEVLAPLSYVLWDQFIYHGSYFSFPRKPQIVKVKEDCPPKRIFRRLAAYVKYQKQRNG